MSSNEPPPAASNDDYAREGADWLLTTWVDAANRQPNPQAGIGVTLFVGGAIVTGTLTSVHGYFTALAEELDADASTEMAEMFRALARDAAPTREADEDDDELPEPQYIHLRDSKVLTDAGFIPHNRGVSFRARLACVDGWLMGIMSLAEPSS
jgi:hypothetical protein